jgi:hypothetical protein
MALALQKTGATTTLAVPGVVNATPALAAFGRSVALVWTASKDATANVYIAMSADGGATFSDARRVNDQDGNASANNEQPPRVAISGSAANPVVTVVWSQRNEGPQKARNDVIRIARSADGGRTFAPSRSIHDPALSGARGWESLATDPDGVVHAVWLDGREADKKMAQMAQAGMPHKGLPPQDVYHGVVASDGRVNESVIATGVCFCCKTAVAADGRGGVYAAWRHIFPGSMRDIAFAKSIDGGRVFAPLVRVSEDNWELNGCPEDGPAMAVDRAGVVHLAWTTLIDEGQTQKALFYSTSRDGKTFSPRSRVPTSGVTNPGHPQMILAPNGGSTIVWDETVDRLRRTSMVHTFPSGRFAAPLVLSEGDAASHPVVARTGAGDLIVAWTSRPSGAAADQSVIRLKRLH